MGYVSGRRQRLGLSIGPIEYVPAEDGDRIESPKRRVFKYKTGQ
jgi:hypothetical protein